MSVKTSAKGGNQVWLRRISRLYDMTHNKRLQTCVCTVFPPAGSQVQPDSHRDHAPVMMTTTPKQFLFVDHVAGPELSCLLASFDLGEIELSLDDSIKKLQSLGVLRKSMTCCCIRGAARSSKEGDAGGVLVSPGSVAASAAGGPDELIDEKQRTSSKSDQMRRAGRPDELIDEKQRTSSKSDQMRRKNGLWFEDFVL
ncbi:hypothetical protein CB1_001148004 [Camelus ferus]|nr:hypothetical protein CB1_001148004 [Camelus ferus]